ncbi:MAG: PVC-type heme-binding CxxCH protein [Gemmataceae bacterium]
MRLALFLALMAGTVVVAFPNPKPDAYEPRVAAATDEPERARKSFRVPAGFQLSLWAAEPLLANPVIFAIDHRGRIFVAETFRLHQGVTDIRGHMDWLDDDLSCRTVEDRVAMYRRKLGKKFAEYNVHHERIRLVEDSKGQGKADRATVFADGFRRPEDGIAAGLLVRGNDIYYACIPDLIHLREGKDGKAVERRALHTGYGVHVGFLGHDLHGLVMGPDGKIYFSVGDRGLNVKSDHRHHFHPDTGCVLRCNPDGSELEVFATGLRNPQELAFDCWGNLFTGDNNSDGGDRARWVYVVEGGDSGWRIGYQFGTAMGNRGPWNAEKLWHPQHAGQPAWHIPPITHLADGPSGLAYYPGVGLPDRYDNHFFLADFRGGAGNSGIRSFAVKPRGAGFELTDSHEFFWSVLATDVDFGPDCALYVSDWVHGWGLTGKGRIWKLRDEAHANDPLVQQTRRLLEEGFEKRPIKELASLLAHRDRRVRQESQFVLARRGPAGRTALLEVLSKSKEPLARVHALWGLGQVLRGSRELPTELTTCLSDKDAEIRAQTARLLGDLRATEAGKGLIALLKDESPRVRFFAAQALGKTRSLEAVPALLALLRDNADRDVYLRHAAVLGLVGCADQAALVEASRDASVAVRRAVVLAYRRLLRPEVVTFLGDADADIVAEAARAINDAPVEAAMPALAALSERRGLSASVGYRVLNARFRAGSAEDAMAIARFAARPGEQEDLRVAAVSLLGDWDQPGIRDRVMGTYRPLGPRDVKAAPAALRASLGGIFAGPNRLRKEAARVAAKLGIKEVGPALAKLAMDKLQAEEVRVEALRALGVLRDTTLEKATRFALTEGTPRLRAEARRHLLNLAPDEALPLLATVAEKGSLVEQQQAFDVLGTHRGPASEQLLVTWMKRLVEGKVEPEVRLDLVEAAEKRGVDTLRKLLQSYEKGRPASQSFGRYQDTLVGGDAEAGRRIFLHKGEVSCLRCHKIEGQGTGEVGPDLTGIGSKQTREYLLESILHPSKQIARGFETVEVVLVTGQVRAGILKSETPKELRLLTAEGTLLTIPTSQIEERRSGKSAMPEDLVKQLSRHELRDLVAFLASLREPKK